MRCDNRALAVWSAWRPASQLPDQEATLAECDRLRGEKSHVQTMGFCISMSHYV